MQKSNSAIVLAAIYLREASHELKELEPEMSLALLESSQAILEKHSIQEQEVQQFKDLSNELRSNS